MKTGPRPTCIEYRDQHPEIDCMIDYQAALLAESGVVKSVDTHTTLVSRTRAALRLNRSCMICDREYELMTV